MKRSATKADLPRRGRTTRSATRKAELDRQRLEQESELEKVRMQRAQDLTATSLLQGLPLVLVSGFLYKYEIRNAALVSKSWKSIWVEAHHELPDYCQVEIKVDRDRGSWPEWVKIRRLQSVLSNQEFSRTIFQKLCDLKVDSEPTERKKQKVRDALPKWGVDFLGIRMFLWGQTNRNNGGIYLTFHKFYSYQNLSGRGWFPQQKLRGWGIRIDHALVLWTWDSFHKWKKIYDQQPLWECEILGYATEEEEDEPEMPVPLAPPRPPPGPGNIDFYFQPRA